MAADIVARRSALPWFLVTAPAAQHVLADRPRIRGAIEGAIRRHRVVTISAPAGSGKTTAIADVARSTGMPVAWLTLTPFGTDRAHLLHGVISAFRALSRLSDDPAVGATGHLDAHLGAQDRLGSVEETVLDRLGELARPSVLVIDDVHLAGDSLAGSVVAALAEHGPPALHLVLVGRVVPLPTARLRVSGELAEIDGTDLRFDQEDVRRAADRVGQQLSAAEARAVAEATSGWAAAVRLALSAPELVPGPDPVSRAGGYRESLVDYVDQEILASLGPDLRDFVLATTTSRILDDALAGALSGRPDARALLRECLRRGLFLDRFVGHDDETVYRWHPVFAHACRTILLRDDRDRVLALNRLVAEQIADRYPMAAVTHALRAGDPGLAVDLIRAHWLDLVLHGEAEGLHEVCGRLPPQWRDRADIALIRAGCLDILGDRAAAATLHRRAVDAAVDAEPGADPAEVARIAAVTRVLVTDGSSDLGRASDELVRVLADEPGTGRQHAATLFVHAWVELRLRRAPGRAIDLLRSAARAADACGHGVVARRARANLAFALAFGGHLTEGRALAVELIDSGRAPDGWVSQDGEIERLTVGYVDYWRDDWDSARQQLRAAAEATGDRAVGADAADAAPALAQVYVAFVAATPGQSPEERAAAREQLARIAETGSHGVPWPTYKGCALATLALAAGDYAGAVVAADGTPVAADVPVTTAQLAELYRRAGHPGRAVDLLESLRGRPTPSPSQVQAGLTRALIDHAAGNPESAHRILEATLDVAENEQIRRPFTDPAAGVSELLVAHSLRGTDHPQFVVDLVARIERLERHRLPGPETLTTRERELLGYLRSTLTLKQIAARMYISLNTAKFHQANIYRKLGVSSRRDATALRPYGPPALGLPGASGEAPGHRPR